MLARLALLLRQVKPSHATALLGIVVMLVTGLMAVRNDGRADRLAVDLAACRASIAIDTGVTHALDKIDSLDPDAFDEWLRNRAGRSPR